jgi:hypothetical protein
VALISTQWVQTTMPWAAAEDLISGEILNKINNNNNSHRMISLALEDQLINKISKAIHLD